MWLKTEVCDVNQPSRYHAARPASRLRSADSRVGCRPAARACRIARSQSVACSVEKAHQSAGSSTVQIRSCASCALLAAGSPPGRRSAGWTPAPAIPSSAQAGSSPPLTPNEPSACWRGRYQSTRSLEGGRDVGVGCGAGRRRERAQRVRGGERDDGSGEREARRDDRSGDPSAHVIAPVSGAATRTDPATGSVRAAALIARRFSLTGSSGSGSSSRISFPSRRPAQWTCDPIVTHTAARQLRIHTGIPRYVSDENATALVKRRASIVVVRYCAAPQPNGSVARKPVQDRRGPATVTEDARRMRRRSH